MRVRRNGLTADNTTRWAYNISPSLQKQKLHIEENEKFNLFFYPYDNPVKRSVVIMPIHISKSILFMSVKMITLKFCTKKYFQISKFVYL